MNSLAQLTDDSLHSETKRLAGNSNTLTAQLLAHLGEVEARGIHRERACSSLYTYCVYELRMSEDEAQRRCRAARLARQFPILLEMLAAASLHLTGILLLGPHLTDENCAELLARARFRTKREIERLVAEIAPSPDVPSRIVPLHRAGAADSMVSPLGDDLPGFWAPPRNTWSAYVRGLAGEVRNLLQHELPARGLVEVQRRALELLVHRLRQRKYAARERPCPKAPEPANSAPQPQRKSTSARPPAPQSSIRARHSPPQPATHTRQSAPQSANQSRYIPAEVRRSVWQRDEARCAYVDARGQRCRAQAGLEFHHQHPHGRGGPPTLDNLALRCRSHNALAAEQDFGRDLIRKKRARRATMAEPIRAGVAGAVP